MVTDDAELGNNKWNNDRWAWFTLNFVIVSSCLNIQTHTAYTIYTLMWYVVNSFVELGKKLLRMPGVKAIFSERFNQDPLREFFWEATPMRRSP